MERPTGSLRSRLAHKAMIADKEARGSREIDPRALLAERGPKSAAKGLAVLALRHSNLPVDRVVRRLVKLDDREFVGVGYSAIVMEGEAEDEVVKLTPIGDGNLDEVWSAFERDNEIGQEVFGDMFAPVDLSIEGGFVGRLKGPFLAQRQQRIEGDDLFSRLHDADEDLKDQIREFVQGYFIAMDNYQRIVDVRGAGNIIVTHDERPRLLILDTGFNSRVEGDAGYIADGNDANRHQQKFELLLQAIE